MRARILDTGVIRLIAIGDHGVMRRVHRWRPPRWFRLWMICATRAGDGWLWWATGLLVLLVGGPERLAAIGSAALAAGVGILIFQMLKRKARRKRPCAIEPHCWATLLPPDQFSFPSGHTITAFAVSAALGRFEPHLMAPLMLCAVSVAVSRILLGMHFLSDVIAGTAIGVGLGYAAASWLC